MCTVHERFETDATSVCRNICVFVLVCGREHILDSILKAAAHGLFAYVSLYCKTQQNKNKLAAQDKGSALTAALSGLCVFLFACIVETQDDRDRKWKRETQKERETSGD